jgi:hypothetical protein
VTFGAFSGRQLAEVPAYQCPLLETDNISPYGRNEGRKRPFKRRLNSEFTGAVAGAEFQENFLRAMT